MAQIEGEVILPKGIPKIRFDYFDLGEIPNYVLCNPDKTELFSLGGISERTLSAKFNALSEISFRADETVDEIKMPYYDYLVNKRLVKVISYDEVVAYFIITDVKETNDGISKYKEITGQSLESEMITKKMVGYMSGSGIWSGSTVYNEPAPVTLEHLLNDLVWGVDTGGTPYGESGSITYIPDWSYENVPSTFSTKYRSFDISDKSVYDFLMDDVEKEYGCVFNFDTELKKIYIYNPEEAITNTDIFISYNNLVKEIQIQEVTDELATCLTVAGGNGLDIINVNPLGNNRIYRLEYFKNTDWMSTDLVTSVQDWENKIKSASATYVDATYKMTIHIEEEEMYQTIVDIASGSIAALQTAIQVATDNGMDTSELEAQLAEQQMIFTRNSSYRNMAHQAYEEDFEVAHAITHELSLKNTLNFTNDQYLQLQPFIVESSFVDDNITVGDKASASTTYEQMYRLYDSASATLLKISEPKYTFDIDSINFMQIKEFQTFRDQIVLGASVAIELKDGDILNAILLEMDLNFDDPSDFKLVFGNRLRMDDESFKFGDLMKRAIDAGNTNKYYGQQFLTWVRNNQKQVIDTIDPIRTVDGLVAEPPSTDVFAAGYQEGVYINKGNFVNIITPALLWNGYPITAAGGGAVLEGPGIDINGITVGLGGDTFLVYNNSGNAVREYGTLEYALASAESGEVVVCPAGTYSGDVTVPAGVGIIGTGNKTTITGSIVLNSYSSLKSITVSKILSYSGQPIYGIVGPSSGIGYINDCSILVNNTGGGDAYSVLLNSAGNMIIWNCYFQSYTTGTGNAIGIYGNISSTGQVDSSGGYFINQASGTGRGHAFVNKGLGDWYITTGKVVATTSPVGDI